MHVGRPQAAVPRGRDAGDARAAREDRTDIRPGPEEGGGGEDGDVVAGGEHEVLLARGVIQDRWVAQDDVTCWGG